MIEKSDITGRVYNAEDCVFFRNITQSIFYMEHGINPIDIFVGGDHKLVMAFLKSDHKKVISLWMANKELNDNKENSAIGDNNEKCW